MPRELMGIWRTDAALYQDRYLELVPGEIRFGIGEDSFTRHVVTEVRRIESLEGVGYRFAYLSEEGLEHFLSLQYDPGEARLSLTHQPQLVWRRTEGFMR